MWRPSLSEACLNLPGIDLAIKDNSTFNATSPDSDTLCQRQELCPNIWGTESTLGATALHFACMRGDLEILNLLLDIPVAHDVRDDSKRLPLEYFDLERVTQETFNAYVVASKAWYMRWRALAQKDIKSLCGAIRKGDYDYCKEILEMKPELARDNHPSVLTALQEALVSRQPDNINLVLSQSDSDDSDDEYPSFSLFRSNARAAQHPSSEAPHPSTLLCYACLLGNMRIVEALLRKGAEWTISDSNNLLPANYASLNGNGKMHEFKPSQNPHWADLGTWRISEEVCVRLGPAGQMLGDFFLNSVHVIPESMGGKSVQNSL
ncbi:hypothetical protein BDP27DRAFT_1427727 [Rhodocollybia butyracea]|uniref:Ankyrin n=1 Tax=Rhodocollybia butyracea TaxID=206335 RepID=A0A9P5PFT6_9AGAR|nr:hypothetical protein BDP27DRAFT_1427727 [Rhodocollybia butyracea]